MGKSLYDSFFPQTGRFTGPLTQEIELCPAHMGVTVNLDLLDMRRAQQEGTFDANAVGSDTANGEVLLVAPVPQTDDCSAD
jgi:hypothetical protein